MDRGTKWGAIALCVGLMGSACDTEGRPGAAASTTVGAAPDTDGPGDTTGTGTTGTSTASASGAPDTTGPDDNGSSGGMDADTEDGPKFDVPADDTMGDACQPDDVCCNLEDGALPPHQLLDAFMFAYPAANMPKSHSEVSAFAPEVDGHAMAWSDENAANELIDSENGGVIEANIETGRGFSREAAEATVPEGSTILEIREDPVEIEDLGGSGNCIGVGWGWGSVLFEAPDASISEVVYLYVGYCDNQDIEAFYYSDQAVQICKPPG